MTPARIPSYIVAYFISSTAIVAGGYSLFNLNPSVIPCSMYPHPQSVWYYYCHWYRACPQWCKYLLIPTGSHAFGNMPKSSAPLLYSNRPLQNTRPPNYYSMLDKTNAANHALLVDYYKRISKDRLAKNAHIKKFSQTTINTLKQKPFYSETYSEDSDDIIKGSWTSGRRTELNHKLSILHETKGDIPLSNLPNINSTARYIDYTKNVFENTSPVTVQRISEPYELPQSTTNHYQNTLSIATLPPFIQVTTVSIQHETNAVKTFTNSSSYDRDIGNATTKSNNQTKSDLLFRKFRATLDQLERKFLLSVFTKLTAISPENRQENGISFLQSGFLLHQLLTALSVEADLNVTWEIEECLGLNVPAAEKIEMLEKATSLLPISSGVLKFRWSSRLVLRRPTAVSGGARRAARAARLRLSWLDGNETAAQLTNDFNKMVELDSGGAMHDTFEEEEFSQGACAAAIGTGYVRAAWRAAPTLLNDSLPFRDAPRAPPRTSRFFRLNDVMGYAYLHEWDAEAIEITYATAGLTLLLLVPKEPALRPLVRRVAERSLDRALAVMSPVRLAVTLPLYTLRMTLLLPNKLEDMGISSLLLKNGTDCDSLKFSHAVQRLMFWAEAGRNAFKDDGIEWDPHPELEIVVDRPYLFFVRWQNITIMNGAFVL